VVAQDRVRSLPADALDGPLREGLRPGLGQRLAAQGGADGVRRLFAGEDGVEVAQLAGDLGHRRRPAEEDALAAQHAGRPQHTLQLAQERPGVLRGQAVADADHVGVKGQDRIDESLRIGGRAGEVRLAAGFLGDRQKAGHAGDMDTVAQAAGQHAGGHPGHGILLGKHGRRFRSTIRTRLRRCRS